ncbi:hypothetical protein NDU88_002510 [Pleurodeles waltl]|uniref:Uncharacterized protein n=1 Tax=Pleurodeles waltl TaxID=8319 RepID=A0AAV7P992_PLEWA|nr:hypothetical protein NDU88_002510 [Pleurodeles waltl]
MSVNNSSQSRTPRVVVPCHVSPHARCTKKECCKETRERRNVTQGRDRVAPGGSLLNTTLVLGVFRSSFGSRIS